MLLSDDQLLGSVRRLTAVTASGGDAAALAQAICDELIALFGSDASAVFRFDGDEVVIVGNAAREGHRAFTRGARFPLEPQMIAARIRDAAVPVRHDRYDEDPSDAARRVTALGYDVVIGAPVHVQDRLWGVVYTAAHGPDRLPAGSEHELGIFAELVTIAVASAEDRERLASRAYEHEALLRAARAALGDASGPDVLAVLAAEAAAMVGARAGALLRAGEDGGFTMAARWPADGQAEPGEVLELAARVRDRRAVERVGDPEPTARADGRLVLGLPVAWAVPIEIGPRLWGALVVAADRGIDVPPDAASRLAQFAELSGLVVANAEAREQLREHAVNVERLASARRGLLVDALESEDRTRRQIGDALHDEVLQELYAAKLDLAEAGHDPEALHRARVAVDVATRQLREAVSDLHPAVSWTRDVGSRLEAVVEQAASRGGFGYRVTCDVASASRTDDLVLGLARELVQNVVKHAQATFVSVVVELEGDETRLEVRDDGRGIAPERPAEALRAGHVGLASARERVEAVGGRFEIAGEPGTGTRVVVRVPRLG